MPTGSHRNGKPLTNLGDGHPRRLSDGRNAWRKMNPEQRRAFIDWMDTQGFPVAPITQDATP